MLEFEKKLMLDEKQYIYLNDTLFCLSDAKKQTNFYFDDEAFYFNQSQTTCRIRLKNGKYTATVKTRSSINSESCRENSGSVKDENDLSFFSGFKLLPQGSLQTERKTFRPEKGIELALDKNTYLGVTDYELELEYEENRSRTAQKIWDKILQMLNRQGESHGIPQSKSERFFERKKQIEEFK